MSGFDRFGSGEAGREGGLCAGRDFSWGGGVVSLVMIKHKNGMEDRRSRIEVDRGLKIIGSHNIP